jgi:hypothetical protein
MTKETLALNHALMIEMIRKHGYSNGDLLALLEKGSSDEFAPFGEGIPDWQTLIDFYRMNTEKMTNAIQSGYRISFLTKGALKSLLGIKFDLQENADFEDSGVSVENLTLSTNQLNELQEVISCNWKIIEESQNEGMHHLKIELTYKPE